MNKVLPLLAKRFLFSRVSDGFLSFIAWVSIIGVALGVLALTVVTSTINGFEGELTKVITGFYGDVVLYSRGDAVENPERIEERIKVVVPGVQAISATFISEGMLAGPNGVSGAILNGVDLRTIGDATTIPDHLISGRMPVGEDEVVLGYAIADKIGATEGAEVKVIIPFIGENQTSKVIKFRTVGILKMGMYEYDSKFAFAPIAAVQKALGSTGKVNTFNIKLEAAEDAPSASAELSENFGYPFRAKYWGELQQNLFYAVKLEKVVIAIILTVIVIVAAFNVVSTLMMMIHDKAKEIAILKAMGFRRGQTFALFCSIGMGIGAIGVGVGIGLGLLINAILKRTKLIDLPPDIYHIGFLPVVVDWPTIILIGFTALLITFAATLLPSVKVAKQSPLDGLRYYE